MSGRDYREQVTLVRGMLVSGDEKEYEFSSMFLRERGWKIVPAPSGASKCRTLLNAWRLNG
jgi:hypothetical protein